MAVTSQTPHADRDVRDARLWARKGPGWLACAKEQGRTEDAERIEGNIAWARSYLAGHGASATPVIPMTPPPAASPSSSLPKGPFTLTTPKPVASTAPTIRGSATAMAEQTARITATMKTLNATAQPPVMGQVAASWDAVGADMAKRMGVEVAEGEARTAERHAAAAPVSTGAGSAWDDIVAQTNASHGLKPRPL